MNRFTRFQRVLMVILIFCTIFSCLMLSLRQNTLTNPGYSAWTYIKYGLIDYPLTSLANATEDVSNLWHVYSDNVYLNEQLASQRSYQTLYQEEKNKNQELETLINMQNTLQSATSISARVMTRSAANWNQTCTISAGSAQGVEKNMLVLSSAGAVGMISDVQTSTSTVAFLTGDAMENDIAIKISLDDGASVEGVLSGYDSSKNAYTVYLFDNTATIATGALVATSGKGGNYPSGILVGTVVDMSIEDDAIVPTIYVQPVDNISSFDYVLVVGSGSLS
jgi:rod shape-determining protein MreC